MMPSTITHAMTDDVRIHIVREALERHVASPSLDHIRDAGMLGRLAAEIVSELFNAQPIWRKWTPIRESFLLRAIPCCIPIEDLTAFLNGVEGPILTATDVQARMDRMCEEGLGRHPSPVKRAFCLAIYNEEKAKGSELAAIVEHIAERCAEQAMRARQERRAQKKRELAAAAAALQARFISGADCRWTPLAGHEGLYCRVKGEAFRLTKRAPNEHLLHRIAHPKDEGALIGRFDRRADASKALNAKAWGG